MNSLRKLLLTAVAIVATAFAALAQTAEDFIPYKQSDLRLPSVPLLVNDPFFSFWSNYDRLNDGPTRHWCEQEKAIEGILRVDGTAYRFMGQGRETLLSPIAGMTVDGEEWSGRVSYDRQAGKNWTKPVFDDSAWAVEDAAWGTQGEYPNVKHEWKGDNKDIYVRRTVTLTADDLEKELWVVYSHDDVFELYINGEQAVSTGETWRQGEQTKLEGALKAALKVGDNIIAAHCHNTTGGSYIDFGLYENLVSGDSKIEKAEQKSLDVMATNTYYSFGCGPVILDLVFTAPMLIDDFDLISTTINYISYQVRSTDGQKHSVQFYLATTAQLTVNEMGQPTLSGVVKERGIDYLKAGSEEQNVLGRSGDLISIDWGYLYIPAINGQVAVVPSTVAEEAFAANGRLPQSIGNEVRSTGLATMPTLAFCNDLGTVDEARSFMLVGYDEVYDMQYMGKNYKAYYARNGKTIFEAFEELRDNYQAIMARCHALDKRIYDDALAAGNQKYAEQLAANYRLVMAAHKLFEDETGKALYFSKENKSNGCVNTVDLTYPESPLYLTYNPELQKGMILSILDYALSDARKGKNCAAHDLGQYPLANGQVYGDSMPLEESANILILANAICRITGDGEWLKPYRTVLKTWADYCQTEGQNPGNQLCTDDFKGPSEQNTNLSIKAIMAVEAYAQLVPYIGANTRDVERFHKYARNMALLWEADARDGDHYKMEFHKRGTWSQKYNLVWDKIWGTKLFPEQVIDREIKFYLNHQQTYGLPLDSRDYMTKSDWIMWTASMSPDVETFLRFSDLHWKYVNETSSRIPLSDFYWADSGVSCNFSARSVLGGLWMKVMMDKLREQPQPVEWEAKGNFIKTRWASEVSPENALPEYPRPLMQRDEWLNLNGLWDYAITNHDDTPAGFDGKILVPFPLESSLSGVMRPLEPGKALWYKKDIEVPAEWDGKEVVLNFGAVDYQADVYIGGMTGRYRRASHTGGHTAFSLNITKFIENRKVTVYLKVIDNTDEHNQPVGKQRRYPNGGGDIFYTSTSGIWQTVWLEAVGKRRIDNVRATSDIDRSVLAFDIKLAGEAKGNLTVSVIDQGKTVAQQTVNASEETRVELAIPNAKLWSPEHPHLYDVSIVYADGATLDQVKSYAALRKISYAKNADGYWRLQLNNSDYFQFGPLDQGYWPDGILTAPTDEALAYDLVKTKEWGFNMVRKHMKVEPARWYYHCDRLGLLVWQDMPSTFRSQEDGWITERWCSPNGRSQDPTVEKNFRNEWKEIIEQHESYPCIVVWTPFNESWGQFKTADIVAFTQQLDPTRLVNPASGGNHYKLGSGTFVDQHTYAQPIEVFEGIVDADRPFVLGEYGGLGRNIQGHRWYERNAQTYNTYTSEKAITDDFVKLAAEIKEIANGYEKDGNKISYSAAVYTQTTDVETEVNGLMTYDREVVKFDESRLRDAVQSLASVYGGEVGIASPAIISVGGHTEYYTLLGLRSDYPVSGINIVRDGNGNVYKFLKN